MYAHTNQFHKAMERGIFNKLNRPDIELAWLAGVLEARGSFTWTSVSRMTNKRYPVVGLRMGDRDTVNRASDIMLTYVHERSNGPGRTSISYETRVSGRRTFDIILSVYPYLSHNKQLELLPFLAVYQSSDKEDGPDSPEEIE